MPRPAILSAILALTALSAAVGFAEDKAAARKPADASAPKYLLQYKFRAGEEVRSKTKHLASIQTTISGTSQKTDMASMSTKLWRIKSVDAAGAITFENLVENVEMWNRMSDRAEVRYNSVTDKKAPLGYEDVAKSVGQILSVITIDAAGAVLKREEKQLRPIADSSGGIIVVPLPSAAVEIGHAWDAPNTINVALKDGTLKQIKIRQHYELQKVEAGIATISVETQVLTPVHNPEIQVQLIQRLSKGEIRFDIKAGRVVSQRTDLDEQVLGFSGGDSSMHYAARFTEDLIPAETKTAKK